MGWTGATSSRAGQVTIPTRARRAIVRTVTPAGVRYVPLPLVAKRYAHAPPTHAAPKRLCISIMIMMMTRICVDAMSSLSDLSN